MTQGRSWADRWLGPVPTSEMLPRGPAPLPVGDLFDQAAALALRKATFVIAVGGPPILIVSILSVVVAFQGGGDFVALWLGMNPEPTPEQVGRALPAFLALLVVDGIGYGVATVALTLALGRLYRGEDPSIGELYAAVLRKLPALLGVMLVWLLSFVGVVLVFVLVYVVLLLAILVAAAAAGLAGPGPPELVAILLIVPAALPILAWAYIFIRWSLALPALMLEDRGMLSALARSWELVRGSTVRVFGLLLLFGLAVAVVSSLPSFVSAALVGDPRRTGPETSLALQFVISGGAQLIFLPPIVAGSVLVFEDLRRLRDVREPAQAGVPLPGSEASRG